MEFFAEAYDRNCELFFPQLQLLKFESWKSGNRAQIDELITFENYKLWSPLSVHYESAEMVRPCDVELENAPDLQGNSATTDTRSRFSETIKEANELLNWILNASIFR